MTFPGSNISKFYSRNFEIQVIHAEANAMIIFPHCIRQCMDTN